MDLFGLPPEYRRIALKQKRRLGMEFVGKRNDESLDMRAWRRYVLGKRAPGIDYVAKQIY